ncbi:MAG TPA: U32 family peptidase [Chitinispirillaceae bacterium]|nr:U32 family peptidase [Chitinispirillaceae bacterium]
MNLSVGYGFQSNIIESLAKFPEVTEIYGKMHSDIFGGGRWSCTLNYAGPAQLKKAVSLAHKHHISFNYLLNSADLFGLEQTISGQKKIRNFLNFLSSIQIDSVTVASPYLLRLIKKQYPQFKVRIGAFAQISSADQAIQWQQMGADILVISAISCNRSFEKLLAIRNSVNCTLELIANSSCLQNCIFEKDHMHLLSRSSCSSDPLKGFLIDYCFLNCSSRRLIDPVNFIRSCWIRPEDLQQYEKIGYSNFKIVERSSPADLIIKRVKAYSQRSFDGNLLFLIAPVAQISRKLGASKEMRFRLLTTMFRPDRIKVNSLILIYKYTKYLMSADFTQPDAPVSIDNKMLDGFLDEFRRNCSGFCTHCSFCSKITEKVVKIDKNYSDSIISIARKLDSSVIDSTLWLSPPKSRRVYE